MASFSRMIDLKIKDKSINIELIDDFDELNNEIISIYLFLFIQLKYVFRKSSFN